MALDLSKLPSRPKRRGHPFGGRKKGSENARTRMLREVSDKALQSGLTPLDVMLDNMKFHHSESGRLLGMILKNVDSKPSPELVRALHSLQDAREMSQKCASEAAPYVHSRLSSVTVKNPPGEVFKAIMGEMTAEEAREEYAKTLK